MSIYDLSAEEIAKMEQWFLDAFGEVHEGQCHFDGRTSMGEYIVHLLNRMRAAHACRFSDCADGTSRRFNYLNKSNAR